MSSVKTLNPKAEVMGRLAALFMNINASKGLLDVMKTNLGPKGTIKMLVGGGGGELQQAPPPHNHSDVDPPSGLVRSLRVFARCPQEEGPFWFRLHRHGDAKRLQISRIV